MVEQELGVDLGGVGERVNRGGIVGVNVGANKDSQDRIEDYVRLVETFAPGDELFLFGFSRGAFTARLVAALIAAEGLVTSTSEAELRHQTLQAYRHFERARRESNGRPLRPWLIRIAHNLASNYHRDRARRPRWHDPPRLAPPRVAACARELAAQRPRPPARPPARKDVAVAAPPLTGR